MLTAPTSAQHESALGPSVVRKAVRTVGHARPRARTARTRFSKSGNGSLDKAIARDPPPDKERRSHSHPIR